VLDVRGVQAGYGAVTVLRDVSLALPGGGVLGVLGANGAGKSTLMRAIAGLVPVSAGAIILDGRDITRASAATRVRGGIALVPEGRLLFPTLSVWDHLWLGGNPRRLGAAAVRARADEVCALFPALGSRLRAIAGVLSGGQQQMLAIGRALMSSPRLLLLDEPSMGLAPKLRHDIYAALARLIAEGGLTVVLVEQDVSMALRLVRQVVVMQGGRIVREGTPAQFAGTADLQHAYLGAAGAPA
jgi:branched-chain amino acid transport system ATP-binding protein